MPYTATYPRGQKRVKPTKIEKSGSTCVDPLNFGRITWLELRRVVLPVLLVLLVLRQARQGPPRVPVLLRPIRLGSR